MVIFIENNTHGCYRKYINFYCIENSYPITITKNNEGILINAIKAYIAIQLFGENLYNRIVNEKDPFIQKILTEIQTH